LFSWNLFPLTVITAVQQRFTFRIFSKTPMGLPAFYLEKFGFRHFVLEQTYRQTKIGRFFVSLATILTASIVTRFETELSNILNLVRFWLFAYLQKN
jgi:hypothetical protein